MGHGSWSPRLCVNGEMKIESEVSQEWKWVMVKPREVAKRLLNLMQ